MISQIPNQIHETNIQDYSSAIAYIKLYRVMQAVPLDLTEFSDLSH